MTSEDRTLLALLANNAREPTASIARKLGVSRTTVQERIRRLEKTGVIAGYTVRLAEVAPRHRLCAQVLMNVSARHAESLVRELKSMPCCTSLQAVSGAFDYVALVEADATTDLDRYLDAIGQLPGVERTQTLVVLSTKFQR